MCESTPPTHTDTHIPHTHKCAQIHTSVWDSKASSKALSRLCNGFASTGCAHPISRAVCMCMLCVCICVCVCVCMCVCVQACVHAWIWQIYNVCVCMRARGVWLHLPTTPNAVSSPVCPRVCTCRSILCVKNMYISTYMHTRICIYVCIRVCTRIRMFTIPRSLATPPNNHATQPRPHNPPPDTLTTTAVARPRSHMQPMKTRFLHSQGPTVSSTCHKQG